MYIIKHTPKLAFFAGSTKNNAKRSLKSSFCTPKDCSACPQTRHARSVLRFLFNGEARGTEKAFPRPHFPAGRPAYFTYGRSPLAVCSHLATTLSERSGAVLLARKQKWCLKATLAEEAVVPRERGSLTRAGCSHVVVSVLTVPLTPSHVSLRLT